jgi:hypothetical protein
MSCRRLIICLSVLLGLSSCSNTEVDTLPSASSIAFAEEDPAESPADSLAATPEDLPVVTTDDVVLFIAAVERSIDGSSHEGIVYESPEVFLAIAQGFCDGLRDGQSVDTLAGDYLAEFSDEASSLEASDDALLIGSVLGAGVETLCDDQSDKI